MKDESRIKAAQQRYRTAMMGVQAGVAIDESRGHHSCTPKQLRVGVNSAMVETAALQELLVQKGVFTWEEWFEALATSAERERESYEKKFSTESTSIKLR